MKQTLISASLALMVLLTSCTDANQNEIFAKHSPASRVYKQELANKIAASSPDSLTFTVNKFLTVNGRDYLDVNITGEGINATSLILARGDSKLAAIRQTKGKGYSGAELKNLRLAVTDTNCEITFHYNGVDKISD